MQRNPPYIWLLASLNAFTKVDLQKEYHIEKILKIDEVLAGKRNNSAGFIFTYK